jgi:hypothetical protein
VSGRDTARKLDAALRVGGAVDRDQNVQRELTALRWTARHQHGDLGGVHSSGRETAENHHLVAGVVTAPDDEEVYTGAGIEQHAPGILSCGHARACLDTPFAAIASACPSER